MRTIIELVNNEEMSTSALGLFARMVKITSGDYLPFEEICKFNVVNTPQEVKETLDELVDHNFILKLRNYENKEIYAVNKYILFETQAF